MSRARTRPRQRLILIAAIGSVLALAVALSAYGLRGYATYFRTPTDLVNTPPQPTEHIRIGGTVVADSIKQTDTGHSFAITDDKNTVIVIYDGLLPDLFREKQGIVIEGTLPDGSDHPFKATRVLAKHDEYYRPAELK